jgi:hypothetical protein
MNLQAPHAIYTCEGCAPHHAIFKLLPVCMGSIHEPAHEHINMLAQMPKTSGFNIINSAEIISEMIHRHSRWGKLHAPSSKISWATGIADTIWRCRWVQLTFFSYSLHLLASCIQNSYPILFFENGLPLAGTSVFPLEVRAIWSCVWIGWHSAGGYWEELWLQKRIFTLHFSA